MKELFYVFTLLLLTSCYSDYNVSIEKDGSAHVIITEIQEIDGEKLEQGLFDEFYEGMDEFQKSNQISGYKREKVDGYYLVEYDIKNVDSLEYYLFPIEGTHPDSVDQIAEFRYTKNSFTITKDYTQACGGELMMYSELIPYCATFTFPKRIKKFKSDFDYIKQVGKKSIEINSNINELSYGEGTKKVEVYF